MVEFCTMCGTSLPKGDVTIRGGELFTSPDYVCPACHRIANAEKPNQKRAAAPEPAAEHDLVFKKGSVSKEE